MKKISPNFYIHEFVPIHIYNRYGEKSKWFLRPEIIKLAEFYRSYFNCPVTVNNWYWGGRFQERGFREPHSKTGAKYSQHKLGAAFDCHLRDYSADDVRREILNNSDIFIAQGLTTLEHPDYAPTWVHSDIRPTGLDEILIIKPAGISSLSLQSVDEYYRWGDQEYELLNFHLF